MTPVQGTRPVAAFRAPQGGSERRTADGNSNITELMSIVGDLDDHSLTRLVHKARKLKNRVVSSGVATAARAAPSPPRTDPTAET